MFLARITASKGIKEYINAAKIVKDKYPNPHILHLGNRRQATTGNHLGHDTFKVWYMYIMRAL